MNNAERILRCLDSHLTTPVELVIYGRAAIALGFENPYRQHQNSKDVDAILSVRSIASLENNEGFWNGQVATNDELASDGLYFTHLFNEKEIIIRDGWYERKVPIPLKLKNLNLFRPATEDLILTKMMRNDPEDLADIQFMLEREPEVAEKLGSAMAAARFPSEPAVREILEAEFNAMKEKVEKLICRLPKKSDSNMSEIGGL